MAIAKQILQRLWLIIYFPLLYSGAGENGNTHFDCHMLIGKCKFSWKICIE